MSKGSWPRKVNQNKFADNYDRIFGSKASSYDIEPNGPVVEQAEFTQVVEPPEIAPCKQTNA